jgi:hypothetical protein
MATSAAAAAAAAAATAATAPTAAPAPTAAVLLLSAYYSAMNAHSVAQALVFLHPAVRVTFPEAGRDWEVDYYYYY